LPGASGCAGSTSGGTDEDHPRREIRGETDDTQTLEILAAIEPHEAAQLLARPERWHQAAYRASREAWRTPAWRAARAMSEDLDKLSVEAMWGTFMNGMRQPGETMEQFTDRVRE
jgi:hypothetical protein